MQHTLCPAAPQRDSFVLQANMSNPKEHCDLGFNHLCIVEGGAFDYTIRLGEMPPAPVEIRVSGAYLQYEPTVVFTPEDYNQPHTVTLVLYDNLDITGNYWMELTHNVTLSDDESLEGSWSADNSTTKWWTAREPTIDNVTAWSPGKLWCDSTGAALPLRMPVLVVENDVSFDGDSAHFERTCCPRTLHSGRDFLFWCVW